MANKRIKQWVYPRPNEMHTIEVNDIRLTSCLHQVDDKGNIIRVVYAAKDKVFRTRNKKGWRKQKPNDTRLRALQAGRKVNCAAGGDIDCPFMRHFNAQRCHKLMAFAFAKRPEYVIVNGKKHKCYMDYERGRMYYYDILIDAKGNPVLNNNGYPTIIRVYLQIDHLNGDHGDYSPDNLEYITAAENYRRRYKVHDPLKAAGLDPKKMPYKLLRNFNKEDGLLTERIRLVKLFFGDMFKL